MPPETLTQTPGGGADPAEPERLDVLIIGAGLSGIGSAHYLQERCPGKTYAILEAREAIGGTWDLFRYPGIRSDSDMHTLGYRFRPWTAAKSIADGESILDYVRATAREAGIDRKVRFGHRVIKASWSSEEARWTVTAERGDGTEVTISAAFIMNCSGYYRYDEGFTPEFAGIEDFAGKRHPSPALARGARIRGQAGGRDRQRRDRGDAGPGDGRGRRPRDDAAALADLRRLGPRRRPGRRGAPQGAAGARPLSDRPLEERPDPEPHLPARPLAPAPGEKTGAQGRDQRAARGLRRRHPLQAEIRPLGPAPLHGPRRRPLQKRSAAARRRSSPTGSSASPRPGSSSSRGRSWRPTWSSPRPG